MAKTNHKETAVSYIRDYLFGIAEDKIDERYGNTVLDDEKSRLTEDEYIELVEFIKDNL